MGYAQGIRWTEELIANRIMEIANTFEEPRMPSKSETENYYRDCKLSSAISSHGGYKAWAERLGLEMKKSETKTGIIAEEYIEKVLRRNGFKTQMTPTKHPYDILVEGCVKIDVKGAKVSLVNGSKVHAYRIAKSIQTCDFYALVEMSDDLEPVKFYILPASIVSGQVQIDMGYGTTIYEEYAWRTDLIEDAVDFYKSMEFGP